MLARTLYLRTLERRIWSPLASRACSSSQWRSKWSSSAVLLRPVTIRMSLSPARVASATTYWIAGLSTTGSISLGIALVAGRNLVPIPAAGMTALVTVPRVGTDRAGWSVEVMAQTLVGHVLLADGQAAPKSPTASETRAAPVPDVGVGRRVEGGQFPYEPAARDRGRAGQADPQASPSGAAPVPRPATGSGGGRQRHRVRRRRVSGHPLPALPATRGYG